MEGYSSTTIFHLPGIFEHGRIWQIFMGILEKDPSVLKTNAKIGSIYGAPGGIWNGGRLQLKMPIFTQEQLVFTRDFMEYHQIPVRFTCTNCLLTVRHLNDTYWNMILDIFNNGNNEIICNSPVLERYLRQKYKNSYKYISSTTKTITNQAEQVEEIDKDYFLTVLDYSHNANLDFLKTIKNKDKCELLCNAGCKPNCPNRLAHYKDISQGVLTQSYDSIYNTCIGGNSLYYQVQQHSHYISPKAINKIYLPMGFKNFKLEGRNAHPLDLVEIILDYLIKDSRKLEVRGLMHQALWTNE